MSHRDDELELELTPEQRRAMATAVVDRVLTHVDTLAEQPCIGPLDDAADRCRAMQEDPPEEGVPLSDLLDPLFEEWIPRTFNAAGPGYMAYVGGGGLFPAALADFIAVGVNRFTGVWNAAPLLVQLEANALDWLRAWMDFPATTRGLLTSGGSMATFSAVVTAREEKVGRDIRDGVAYVSSEAHTCIKRAARMAGILDDRVRTIDVDDSLRLRVDHLQALIASDRKAGLRPFFVASSAGTVNTGVVDPIVEVGELCRREGLWHHVDGAYGGFFHLVPELRPVLQGLSAADSLVLDPHKGLFLPFGTGALLVRDGDALRRAHDWEAGYLPPLPDPEFYNPTQYGPELTRDYRGLRLWLPLKLFGVKAFRSALREKRELAMWAYEQLSACPELELGEPPALTLFAFQVRWSGAEAAERSAATRELLARVARRGRVLLSGAEIGDRFLGRLNVLSVRTHRDRVEEVVAHLQEEARAVVAERQ